MIVIWEIFTVIFYIDHSAQVHTADFASLIQYLLQDLEIVNQGFALQGSFHHRFLIQLHYTSRIVMMDLWEVYF